MVLRETSIRQYTRGFSQAPDGTRRNQNSNSQAGFQAVESASDLRDKKILIVDDQSFNIDALNIILKTVLKLNTAKLCSFALSGSEAIEKVKASTLANGGECGFSLVLMDCNMPVIDGYSATQ